MPLTAKQRNLLDHIDAITDLGPVDPATPQGVRTILTLSRLYRELGMNRAGFVGDLESGFSLDQLASCPMRIREGLLSS